MKIIFISIVVIVIIVVLLLASGIVMNKRNLTKDKYDLLNYFEKNKDKLSITLKENGHETIALNSKKLYPLASTLKIIIAFNFVKSVANNKLPIHDQVDLQKLDQFYIPNTDGGAHPNWKHSLNRTNEVSLLEVAKGMMQFSSNACTNYLINKIGINDINQSIKTLKLNHDKISYLTSAILIPGYLSDKRNIAINKLNAMNKQSYQKLSQELFEPMQAGETSDLKEKVNKMLTPKMQLILINKTPCSTTKEYAHLMFRLGQELLSKKEKELFSDILGKDIKNDEDDYFWFKGGSTMFVLTSALYKESQDSNVSVSLFVKDDTGGELYWIRNVLGDFVKSIATDSAFRKRVKEMAN